MRVVLLVPEVAFQNLGSLDEVVEGPDLAAPRMRLLAVKHLAVLVDDCGVPMEVVNQYLASVAIKSRGETVDTVRTYAESLLEWLKYLKLKRIEQAEVTEEDLQLFRNHLANAPRSLGRVQNVANTVNLRTTVARAFHLWGQKTGVLCSPLGRYLQFKIPTSSSRNWTGEYAVNRSPDSVRMPATSRLPQSLKLEEISRLLNSAPERYRLMFRWGVVVGLRRFEVCQLSLRCLPSIETLSMRGMDLVTIEIKRKGSKTCTVYLPVQIIEETHRYILTERPAPTTNVGQDTVFLKADGTPYSRQSLSRTFRRCADSIGSEATLHHLRHTFATHILAALEARESREVQMNSLKVLQVMLGHSNISTVDTYLRALRVTSDEVRDALGFLYGATE